MNVPTMDDAGPCGRYVRESSYGNAVDGTYSQPRIVRQILIS